MADFDWTSLAATVLPAVVGAMGGARQGGIGAIPGGLYGVGSAARENINSDLERQKLNTDIAFRNQTQQLAQQRIENEKRQQEAQNAHWQVLNGQLEESMKSSQLHRQQLEQTMKDAETNRVRHEEIRNSLSPEDQKTFDTMGPTKWGEHQADKELFQNATGLLGKLGISPNDAMAMGKAGVSHAYGAMQAAEKSRKPEGHFDSASGMAYIFDPNKMTFSTQQLRDPIVPPEKASKIEDELTKIYKVSHPQGAIKLDEGDDSDYKQWRASDEAEIHAKRMSGQITPAQQQALLRGVQRADQQLTAQATEQMRQAYLATDPKNTLLSGRVPQTDKGFLEYLNSPAGQTRLGAYKRAIKAQASSAAENPAAFADSAAKDLEYATKSETSLAGRSTGAKDEPTFAQWKAKYAPQDSGKDYDLQGAYEYGLKPTNGHFPDTFKLPNHPKFSIESKYWKPGMPAGRWEGENYIRMSGTEATAWVKQHGQNMAPADKGGVTPQAATQIPTDPAERQKFIHGYLFGR